MTYRVSGNTQHCLVNVSPPETCVVLSVSDVCISGEAGFFEKSEAEGYRQNGQSAFCCQGVKTIDKNLSERIVLTESKAELSLSKAVTAFY